MSKYVRSGITNGSRAAGDDVPGYFGICDGLVALQLVCDDALEFGPLDL